MLRPVTVLSASRRPVYGLAAILAILLLAVIAQSAGAQLVTNNGATITAKAGAVVQVNGAVTNKTASTIDNSGTITITTDFTNNLGTSNAGGSGTWNIAGNFSNSGVWTTSTGFVNFNGSGAQAIGGSAQSTFYQVQFSNGGAKTLGIQENVSNNADFVSGRVYTTNTNVLHFNSAANFTSATSASYVDGPAEKDFLTAVEWTYPVGDNGSYNRCGVQPSLATACTYRTQYKHSKYSPLTPLHPPIVVVSTQQYWFVDSISGASNPAKVHLYWISGDYGSPSYIQTPSNLVVGHWNGFQWWSAGKNTQSGNYVSGDIQSNNWSYVGPPPGAAGGQGGWGAATNGFAWTLASITADNTLPVEMGPFTVKQEGDHVNLKWKTYAEIENLGFEVERKQAEGTARVVDSYGTDTALLAKSQYGANYQTTDLGLTPGQYTYELYQVDVNGTRTFSGRQTLDFIHVDPAKAAQIQVYPNPASNLTHVDLTLQEETSVQIEVLDVTGKEVMSQEPGVLGMGAHSIGLDLSNLANGAYTVIMLAGGNRVSKSIIVTR